MNKSILVALLNTEAIGVVDEIVIIVLNERSSIRLVDGMEVGWPVGCDDGIEDGCEGATVGVQVGVTVGTDVGVKLCR